MKYVFKILLIIFLSFTFPSYAKEVIPVEGVYSYGPSISQNEACDRAIMNGKISRQEGFRRKYIK